jgi:hypothetical protein
MNPLVIGADEIRAIAELRAKAEKAPVDMTKLMVSIKTKAGKRAHMGQMILQSIPLPVDYFVTFSIETGHPIGTCRHMSISSGRKNKIPTPEAVWMVAQEFGFISGLEFCMVYNEDIRQLGQTCVAVNVVQPLAVQNEGNA